MKVFQYLKNKIIVLIKWGGVKSQQIKNLILGLINNYVFLGQYVTNRNIGDALGLLLSKELNINNGRVIPMRLSFKFIYERGINLQFVGSTLGDTNRRSIIIGAGAVSADTIIKEKPHKIFSVRGPLTRDLLLHQGIKCPEVYGDPGVLLPLIYQPNVKKKYKLGLIPHYVDQNKDAVRRLLENKDIHFINILLSPNRGKPSIYEEWKNFINDLCSCEVIVSSSLHGLIIADAYNIPTVWVKFGNDINGNDFKYKDYYASLNITDIKPLEMSNEVYGVKELISKAQTHDVTNLQRNLLYLRNFKI